MKKLLKALAYAEDRGWYAEAEEIKKLIEKLRKDAK